MGESTMLPPAQLPPLIREDGQPFDEAAIERASRELDSLGSGDKTSFRNTNSAAIATHPGSRMLIVSGPGTGKSYLFLSRLKYWLDEHPGRRIAVATFVRKLAHDLGAEIDADDSITPADKSRVEVVTLHRLARSIVERNHGIRDLPLREHARMVAGSEREEMIWADVFCFHQDLSEAKFPWSELRDALYDGEAPGQSGWGALRATHLRLQQFYNAVTFPDLILLATQAVVENPGLAADTMFIFDEFQDFNLAEDGLIRVLTREAPGLLLVGDDDQVLYDRLRGGRPQIIRGYYQDEGFVNAMLPFCIRCGYHICKTAEAFLAADRPRGSIRKVFLPFREEEAAEPVRVIAATTPNAAVDYIEGLLEEHAAAIHERQEAIDAGTKKDPYLLILTPAREMKFLDVGGARDRLRAALDPYTRSQERPGEDYWRVRDYYYSSRDPFQNYTMRKVLDHEATPQAIICALLEEAVTGNRALADLAQHPIRSAREKSQQVRDVIDSDLLADQKVRALQEIVPIGETDRLQSDLERLPFGAGVGVDEEPVDLEQKAVLAAVELTTIVGAKGLSADCVLVLGCDQANLAPITRSAFFVALTRARRSLAVMAALGGGGATRFHEFVRSLPDEHADAVLARAHGHSEDYESIAGLQAHLEAISNARAGRRRASRRGPG